MSSSSSTESSSSSSDYEEDLSPMQNLLCSMAYVEQYSDQVLDYTSKYNNEYSVTYSPENITGAPSKYPQYGDFPETYLLRTYGKWWKDSLSIQPAYMPPDCDHIEAEDYITLHFEIPVVPIIIKIYETYNPGAVVRIYGCHTGRKWHLLYEQTPGMIPYLENTSRCFCPELIEVRDIVNEIRIEFNQTLLAYHTGLDAVLLAGYSPKTKLQLYSLQFALNQITQRYKRTSVGEDDDVIADNSIDYFTRLPDELMVHIFKFLDLKTLQNCALVNKRFNQISKDASIYTSISLKKYWMIVDDKTLQYFQKRCKYLKKLDLRWCGSNYSVKEDTFEEFIMNCGSKITHLTLSHCEFVGNVSIQAIGKLAHLEDLRLRNCHPDAWSYIFLIEPHNIQALDLSSTSICNDSMSAILKANRNLKHLLIDYCEHLTNMDAIAEILSKYNQGLITLSCWKTGSLTARGVRFIGKLSELKELDMGWCLLMTAPINCLHMLAQGCIHLTRLIISNWRGVSDQDVMPIISNCKQLEIFDLLGIPNITASVISIALATLPKLRLLELSYCERILPDEVATWREQYPHISILHNHETPA